MNKEREPNPVRLLFPAAWLVAGIHLMSSYPDNTRGYEAGAVAFLLGSVFLISDILLLRGIRPKR